MGFKMSLLLMNDEWASGQHALKYTHFTGKDCLSWFSEQLEQL